MVSMAKLGVLHPKPPDTVQFPFEPGVDLHQHMLTIYDAYAQRICYQLLLTLACEEVPENLAHV
jgi:hypothetical protein